MASNNMFFPENIDGGKLLFNQSLSFEAPLTPTVFGSIDDLCPGCGEDVKEGETTVINKGTWHEKCFVCAQCFKSFPDGLFYTFDGRNFCEYDFLKLHCPVCAKCGVVIKGRFIRANKGNWHPDCLKCQKCSKELLAHTFRVFKNKVLCSTCSEIVKEEYSKRKICFKCKGDIEGGMDVHYLGEIFHAFHFDCFFCHRELHDRAVVKEDKIYCQICYDKNIQAICAGCRRPVEDERLVLALNKTWHKVHFMCSTCDQPFMGSKYFEIDQRAYCPPHYFQLKGNVCFICSQTPDEDLISIDFGSKIYCPQHFRCIACDTLQTTNSKLSEIDMRPCCHKCMKLLPRTFRKHLIELGNEEDLYPELQRNKNAV